MGSATTVHGLVETCESAALGAVGANDANPVASKCDSKKTAAMGNEGREQAQLSGDTGGQRDASHGMPQQGQRRTSPSCSAALNGNATASAHVQCLP
jgi:hypothetical protein